MKLLSLFKAAKSKAKSGKAPPPAPAPPTPVGAGLGLFDNEEGSSFRRVVPAKTYREQTPLVERLGSLFGEDHVPWMAHGAGPPTGQQTAVQQPVEQPVVQPVEQPVVQATAVQAAPAPTQVLQGWVVPNPETAQPAPRPVQVHAAPPVPVLPWEAAQKR